MTCTLKMLNIADALYTPRVLRMIQLRRRSLTNITTSLDRPHPGAAPFQQAPLIRAFLRCRKGPCDFRHNSPLSRSRLCRWTSRVTLDSWSPKTRGRATRAGLVMDRGDQRTTPQSYDFDIKGTVVPPRSRRGTNVTATSGRNRRGREDLDTCSRVVPKRPHSSKPRGNP